jgi:uncharacterized membrane protein
MKPVYNLIAGQNLERLAALSDGLFAIAMTLLVLDLRVPVSAAIHSERDLLSALVVLSPRLLAYFMSFMTLGLFWVGQQTQLSCFARSDRNLAWIQIGFLAIVALMPFSTALLAEFISYRLPMIFYWLNIFLMGVTLFASWRYAMRAGLLKDDTAADMGRAVERRIIIGQVLYALSASLCIFNTYWSIVAIVLVQLNYVLAPRWRALYRL